MPWKSEAQRKFMYARHPEIAKRFQEHTPKGTKLPEHVGDKKKMRKHEKKAFDLGTDAALNCFGYKSANLLNMAATGVKRVAGMAPGIGTAVGAGVGAIQGGMTGGLNGAIAGGAAGAMPGMVPGMVAEPLINAGLNKINPPAPVPVQKF